MADGRARQRSFDDDAWELYDTRIDWTQSRDLAADAPAAARPRSRRVFGAEAEKHQVFPLDDRVTGATTPRSPVASTCTRPHLARASGRGPGRLTEEAAPNVKNRSHDASRLEVTSDAAAAEGVLVAQGGRFGGWSLYCRDGRLSYAYNCYGRSLTTVRAPLALGPGSTSCCSGSRTTAARRATARRCRSTSTAPRSRRHVPQTTAYYFSFDETFNVGVDRGTPVTDDYAPVRSAFTGTIHGVRVDLAVSRREPLRGLLGDASQGREAVLRPGPGGPRCSARRAADPSGRRTGAATPQADASNSPRQVA